MIRRLYSSLPGPAVVRVLLVLLIAVVALALLIVFYEWLGNTFLDSGGGIG